MKRFFKVRKGFIGLLVVAVSAYYGYNFWTYRKAMSSLPELPTYETTTVDLFAEAIPATVTSNGRTYEIVGNRHKWIPVIYFQKDYAAFEKHASAILEDMDDAESFELTGLYNTLGLIREDDDIETMEAVLNEWCETGGDSHIPWLIRGRFRINHAWSIRGGGYANTVSEAAWKGFKEKLAQASEDLEKSYSLNPDDPNSSAALVVVAKGLGLSEEAMEESYQNAVSAFPGHYYANSNKLEYLTPYWHGSEKRMFEFAESVAASKDDHPPLGSILVEAFRKAHYTIHKDQGYMARNEVWSKIEEIYEAFFKAYPDNLRMHYFYAKDAILAKKYDKAIEQFEIIGDRWEPGSNFATIDDFNQSRASSYVQIGYRLIYEEKMYDPAIGFLESANEYRRDAYSSNLLGIAYEFAGYRVMNLLYLRKAQNEYKKALVLDPEHKQAKKNLIRLAKKLR